ncbi:MAG: hypothetical protein B6241_05130 [Spirochaetaceae bacterium 4572_59]|nr:MAG: hypothetical protein B6241_05130 [Spirochaetaceae bacterium 4572_59]
MAKTFINEKEQERISVAVKEAEKSTSGEIATALIGESSDYALYELVFSLCIGFVYFSSLLFFYPSVSVWLGNLFWDAPEWYVTAFYGISTVLVVGLVYFFSNMSFVDRLIIPRKVLREKVRNRALRYFTESGVYSTRDHTGILIFVSLLEKRVEVLADQGISEKIPQNEWNELVAALSRAMRDGQLAGGLCAAVESCGKKLSKHFPIKSDDSNELSDSVDILES